MDVFFVLIRRPGFHRGGGCVAGQCLPTWSFSFLATFLAAFFVLANTLIRGVGGVTGQIGVASRCVIGTPLVDTRMLFLNISRFRAMIVYDHEIIRIWSRK